MPKKYIMNLFHELSRPREKKINKIWQTKRPPTLYETKESSPEFRAEWSRDTLIVNTRYRLIM